MDAGNRAVLEEARALDVSKLISDADGAGDLPFGANDWTARICHCLTAWMAGGFSPSDHAEMARFRRGFVTAARLALEAAERTRQRTGSGDATSWEAALDPLGVLGCPEEELPLEDPWHGGPASWTAALLAAATDWQRVRDPAAGSGPRPEVTQFETSMVVTANLAIAAAAATDCPMRDEGDEAPRPTKTPHLRLVRNTKES